MIKPLSNIKVLDLSRVLAGPMTSMLLAEYGAEIIKIEKPKTGDDTRSWGPPFNKNYHNQSTYFQSINFNKKSLAIDMRKPQGQEILHQLASKSDIIIENFKPNALQKYNLDFDYISKNINPQVIYTSLTGYGQTGPYKNRGGYDVIASSLSGFMSITGTEQQVIRPGVAITDISTALYAHGAILAAALEKNQKQEDFEATWINCNLLATQISVNSYAMSNFLNGDKTISKRWGTAHPSIVPYQSFKCSDGCWLTLGIGNDKQYQDFLQVLAANNEDQKILASFKTNKDRVNNRNILIPILERIFKNQTSDFWMEKFGKNDDKFPFGRVNNIDQVFEDPQVKHLDLVVSSEENVKGLRHPVTFGTKKVNVNGEQNMIKSPPLLGENTRRILTEELDFSSEQIDSLIDQNIVFE